MEVLVGEEHVVCQTQTDVCKLTIIASHDLAHDNYNY